VYPCFDSGSVLGSSTDRGLVVLRPQLPGFGRLVPPTALAAAVAVGTVTLTWTDADPRAGAHI
jgi:hypothetical protein